MEVNQLADAAGIDPGHAEQLIDGINGAIQTAQLDTPERLAAFIAQCGHESAGFKFFEENLNYKAESLHRTWPSHFHTMEIANEYAHQPKRIACRAYADRMGNGDEESGDGWSYRGRGAIQLTGKIAYEEASRDLGFDFVSNPDAASSPEGGLLTAAWFWAKHNLNYHVDNNDFEGLTKAINGGTIGLEDRVARFNHAMSVLA
jgi:putative chitinase